LLPQLATELEASLAARNRPALVAQIDDLRITAVCPCIVESCGSFHTAKRPMVRWFRRGEQIHLDDVVGTIVVDVVGGEIVYVEVLDRPEIREALSSLRTDT
jgi:hypothetical protein